MRREKKVSDPEKEAARDVGDGGRSRMVGVGLELEAEDDDGWWL